jgi:hypothetical protein
MKRNNESAKAMTMTSKIMIRCAIAGVAATFATTAATADELRELRLEGRLHVADKTYPATLRAYCAPLSNGALGLELVVPDATTRKDFDYDDFEGPDAVAAKRALTRIGISGESGKTEIAHAAAGWYGVEPADSFVFGVSQTSLQRGALTNLIAAFDGHRGHVVWVQTAFDDSKRELRGAFDFDDATAKKLRDVVAPCGVKDAAK